MNPDDTQEESEQLGYGPFFLSGTLLTEWGT